MIYYDTKDRTLSNIAKIVEKRYKGSGDITLKIDAGLNEFDSKIDDGVIITAGAYGQLLDAAGRFLRNPSVRGSFHSDKQICGVYFASHNKNYYEKGPLEELYDYIDDLALWGMNTFKLWFDMYYFKDMTDGREYAERLKKLYIHAKSIGVKTILSTLANEAFMTSPKELRADWTGGHDGYIKDLEDHYHVEICPSKKGGMEKIIEYRRQMLEVFAEAEPDYISIGPYDEGGCTCPECAPWGCNGYIRTCEALIPVIKEYLPNAKIIMGTWQFGSFTGNDVEAEGLKRAFEEGRLPECKYLIAEPQYIRYPFEHDMKRPIIGFPEISMYGAMPWGGYGANPMPNMLGNIWHRDGGKLEGGYSYSEGFYEDINKVIVLRLYRDNQNPVDTVREYLKYEFKLEGEDLEKAAEAVMDMETTLERTFDTAKHTAEIKNQEKVFDIEKKMQEVHDNLPEHIKTKKRWLLLYLRSKIDAEFVRNNSERNDTIIKYFNQIIEFSHLQNSRKITKPDISFEVIDFKEGKPNH